MKIFDHGIGFFLIIAVALGLSAWNIQEGNVPDSTRADVVGNSK